VAPHFKVILHIFLRYAHKNKCNRDKKYEESPKIIPGMVLAVEVMYAAGSPAVVTDEDGWTISMRDGKISGLFEETVAVTDYGPLVLT